jgi:hypothetical protein
MIAPKHQEKGFSTVELLITLFVAVAFIGTGFQLYSIIINDGGAARVRAKASNIAYDNLRRYAPQATSPCTVFTPTPTATIPAGSGLPSPAAITVTPSCPYTAASTTTKVQVRVTYGSPEQEVVHALFVTN